MKSPCKCNSNHNRANKCKLPIIQIKKMTTKMGCIVRFTVLGYIKKKGTLGHYHLIVILLFSIAELFTTVVNGYVKLIKH